MSAGGGTLEIVADREALAHRAAEWLVAVLARRPPDATLTVALSGGSTPRRLYELLAAPPYRAALPWSRIDWFWGDERFVPPDHELSNARMVREAMLSRVPVALARIHPVPTLGLTPPQAADAYAAELRRHHGGDRLDPDRPLFDATLLGLGNDGHTASLFPGSPALVERLAWVVAVEVGARPEARITLTLPALASSRAVAVLVAGNEKRSALRRVLAGDTDIPAARLRPVGSLLWLADRDAAEAG